MYNHFSTQTTKVKVNQIIHIMSEYTVNSFFEEVHHPGCDGADESIRVTKVVSYTRNHRRVIRETDLPARLMKGGNHEWE